MHNYVTEFEKTIDLQCMHSSTFVTLAVEHGTIQYGMARHVTDGCLH